MLVRHDDPARGIEPDALDRAGRGDAVGEDRLDAEGLGRLAGRLDADDPAGDVEEKQSSIGGAPVDEGTGTTIVYLKP